MKPSDLGIPLHRSRVFGLRTHIGAWESRCNECNARYLTDAGWYDAMGAARRHYRDELKRVLTTFIRTGAVSIDDARQMLGLQPLDRWVSTPGPITGQYLIDQLPTPTSPPDMPQIAPRKPDWRPRASRWRR